MGLLDGATTALDAEIARWETRSRRDPEARTVLRVFLGLREVLWELGVRESSRAESRDPTAGEEPDAPPSIRRRRRVERVPVED